MIRLDDPDRSGLRAQNRVFEGLRSPQTYYRLCFDLDWFAGLRVATHTRLAMSFHRASQVGNYELARAALALFHRQLEELVKKRSHRFFWRFAFLRQMAHNLGLAQWLCHFDASPPLTFVLFEPSWRPEPGPRTRATIKRVATQRKRKCEKAAEN